MRTGKTIIQINGLMRSGNHAIIRWLTSLFDDCTHLNNLEHDFFVSTERVESLKNNSHHTIICSFEDFPRYYDATRPFRASVAPPDPIAFPDNFAFSNFYVLRDVYNCLASRINSHIVDSENTAADVDRFLDNWIDLSNHYLENPNHFILYNEWRRNEEYRRWLCAAVAGVYSEATLHDIPNYGGGSSFDRTPLPPLRDVLSRAVRNGDLTFVNRVAKHPGIYLRRLLAPKVSAQDLDVETRWPLLCDVAIAERVFRDPLVARRNFEIFGFAIDENHRLQTTAVDGNVD